MSYGIDLMSRVTCDRVPVPEVSKRSARGFGPESEVPRGEQLSRAMRARL